MWCEQCRLKVVGWIAINIWPVTDRGSPSSFPLLSCDVVVLVTQLSTTMSVVEKVGAGKGRIQVRSDGFEAVLSELSYSYPLKLLSPRLSCSNVAVVYVLTYGGGLVAGDSVDLNVKVENGTALVLLTQVRTLGQACLPFHLDIY
jgi:hypothetical protein